MKKSLFSLSLAFLGLAMSSNAQVIYTENFDSPLAPALPAGWSSGYATPGASGWNTGAFSSLSAWGTATSTTLPSHPSQCVFVNDWGAGTAVPAGSNTSDTLKSASFSLSTAPAGSVWLSYDYFYYNAVIPASGHAESLYVLGSSNDGATWVMLDTLMDGSGWDEEWRTGHVNLGPLGTSSTCKVAFVYKDGNDKLVGIAIDNVSVYQPAANDIALTAIAPLTGTPASYGVGGSTISVRGSVYNNGGTTITSYDIKYVFNGGTVVTNPVTGVSIAPYTSATFTATTPVTMPTAVGPYQLQVWASLSGDANPANDTAALDTLNTASFLPTKRLAIEEGTGTWCGWCPRGAVYMDSLHTLYGDGISLVAVHNGTSPSWPDPMRVAAYDSWLAPILGGFPNVLIDRRYLADPSDLLDAYTALSNTFAYADITAVPTVTGSSLSVAVSVKPATNLNNARLALVLTEDKVHGTTTYWGQRNYYSGDASVSLTGQGLDYYYLPDPIPAAQMYYNHVARTILPTATGGTGLLPASMTYGTPYNYTFTTTLDAGWAKGNVHAVVLLIDGRTGAVLNSVNVKATVGIKDVEAGINNLVVAPNPATSEAIIRLDLKNASKVQVEISDVTGRSVYSAPATEFAAGNNMINIPLDQFATGIYNVKVQTESGLVTTKLNVVK